MNLDAAIATVRQKTTLPRPVLMRFLGQRRGMSREELLTALHNCNIEEGNFVEGLGNAFIYTIEIGLRTALDYDWQAKWRRASSYAFRIGGIVSLVLGILAPLAVPLVPAVGTEGAVGTFLGFTAAQLPHVGYIFMAIGGALVLGDRVFVATSGWTRVVTAKVALEDSLLTLLYEWKIRQLAWPTRAFDRDTAIRELTFLKAAADSFMEDYKAERAAWKAEILAGAGELSKHLRLDEVSKAMHSEMVKEVEAVGARARRVEDARLELRVDFTSAPIDAFAFVAFTESGQQRPEEQKVGKEWPVANFDAPQGTHRVTVVADGRQDPITESITLKAGPNYHEVSPWSP